MNGAKAVFDKAVASPHVRWEKEMFGLFFSPHSVLALICAQTWLQSGCIFVLLQQGHRIT